MKIFRVLITEPAEHDLHAIINYVSRELQIPLADQTLLNKIGKRYYN